ncbi:MAG: thermonuclease family protein [Syntrophothermus sp.]|nr:thermonuclease family protein [Syntrophothermus sp.]
MKNRLSGLKSAILLFLFLACGLIGCGGQPDDFLTRQQATIESQGAASNRQEAGEQPENDNRDSARLKLIPAEVTRVVDGDTLWVRIGTREEKVRLIGVNTPEISHSGLGIKEEPYGKEAFEYTRKHSEGRQVFLELDVGERDRYGRLLAYVWLDRPGNDGEAEVRAKMYNAELLLNGYAQVMTVPPNVKYADFFVKLEREAREQAKGLWGAAAASSTSNSQPAEKRSSAAVHIGNSSSKKFHYPDCQWTQEISTKNRVEFSTRGEAIEAGYEPCKACRP